MLKRFLNVFNKDEIKSETQKEDENAEIISAYHMLKRSVPSFDKPNYELAKKVFLDFNDFNLKNIDELHVFYLSYIPKSLLPYPKNYIKCAYYIFLEKAKKDRDLKLFNLIQEVGVNLFTRYPDYKTYKENLKRRNWDNNVVEGRNPREKFKKLYGCYEISEGDYNSSPNSIDCSDEKLLYDFGFLPEIEDDVNFGEVVDNVNKK